MKKMIALLSLLTMLLTLVACGERPVPSDPRTASATPTTESVESSAEATPTAVTLDVRPTAQGEHAVCDGQYVYFTVHSDDDADTFKGDVDGLYRADLSMQNPVRLARGDCRSLALDEQNVYFWMKDRTGETAICSVDKQGSAIRRIVTDVPTAGSLGIQNGKLFYVYMGELCIVEDMESGEVSTVTCDDSKAVEAHPGEGNTIWISAQRYQVLTHSLFLYDPDAGTNWAVVPVNEHYAVAEDGTVYFILYKGEEEEKPDSRDNDFILMKMEQVGDMVYAGIDGRFVGDIYAYGPYVFYSKYVEVEEQAGKREATVKKLFCFNPRTGQETQVALNDLIGIDYVSRGFAAGRFFFDGYLYDADHPGDEEFGYVMSADMTGAGSSVMLDTLVASATDSEGVQADDRATQAIMDERAQQEIIRRATYGPGTSSLYLKAGSRSACYRLVRTDGVTEFKVLLGPGESVTKSFPCGIYVLKVAYGDKWISDEEAFGSSGSYSSTSEFNFREGETYEISTGKTGNFHSDNQSGFMS